MTSPVTLTSFSPAFSSARTRPGASASNNPRPAMANLVMLHLLGDGYPSTAAERSAQAPTTPPRLVLGPPRGYAGGIMQAPLDPSVLRALEERLPGRCSTRSADLEAAAPAAS